MFSRRVFMRAMSALAGPAALPGSEAAAAPLTGPRPAGTMRIYGTGEELLAEIPVTWDESKSAFVGVDELAAASGVPEWFLWVFPDGAILDGTTGLGPGHGITFPEPIQRGGEVCFEAHLDEIDGTPGNLVVPRRIADAMHRAAGRNA